MKQDLLEIEKSITLVKEVFAKALAEQLQLYKVSSPLIVLPETGLNDDLNGIERPVSFPIKALNERKGVVVHSLAKWKRQRLKELGVEIGKGIITDMRALRPDEDYSPLHSIYVDQWDWEKCITRQQRTLHYLKETVVKIYESIKQTEEVVSKEYGLSKTLPELITFIHSEELLQLFPTCSVKEREDKIAEKYGAVFIIGIGEKLSNGEAHDGRAPDYDDWSTTNEEGFKGLNGDIVLWNSTLKRAFEVSSMGIRVDETSLKYQLKERKSEERAQMPFHSQLLKGDLPFTIGGGIGQSRICMFMLQKFHIGEVQIGVWPEQEKSKLEKEGVILL